jgi:hypothetical protein
MHIKQIIAAAALTAVATTGIAATASAKDNGKIEAERFTGVPTALTRANGNFAGINGGGLAWGIGEAEVAIDRSGKVEVEFEGLVFTDGPNTGRNTVASMAVALSCKNLDGAGFTVAVSAPFDVTTMAAPELGGGDAEAETTIGVPETCASPTVFITNATGTAWFAVEAL